MNKQDIIIVISTLAVVAAALRLTQRFIPHHRREPHNDVAGFIFAAIAIVYAVPLAFVVVAVWSNADSARQNTFQEADELAGVYWVARQLPLPLGAQLEHETLAYAHTVVNAEWPLLEQHQSSPAATQLVYQMRASVFAFAPADDQQQVLFEHAVTHVESLASDRRARLNEAADQIPDLLWIVLVAGGVVTVGFTFLFGLSSTIAHTLMVVSLAGLIVFSLVVIKEMSYPFAGATKVDPTAFSVFLSRLPVPR